jgi:VWFA-related protein
MGFALLFSSFLAAQQSDSAPQPPVISPASSAKAHTVVITAIRKKGSGAELLPADLEVKEDGKPATITTVRKLGRVPLHYCLVFDTNKSQSDSFKLRQREATKLLSTAINPDTNHGWLVLSAQVVSESRETADPQPISSAIDQQTPGGVTSLHDAMGSCASRMLKADVGPEFRTLLLFSDGESKPSHMSDAENLDPELRGGTRVYVFSTKPSQGAASNELLSPQPIWPNEPRSDMPGRQIINASRLALMASSAWFTGGRMFECGSNKDMELAIDQLSQDLQNQVEVSYVPARGDSDNHRHNIEVRPRAKGLTVLAPMQYIPTGIAQ